jgi:long-chain acyl-CoA synthetase
MEKKMSEKSLGDRIWYKHWLNQVPKCLEYPECSLAEFLRQTTLQYGSRVAVNFLDTTKTYNELWDLVQRFATGLSQLGLQKSDVCALMLPNSYQYVIGYYACQLIGVTVTAINPTYKAFEIQHILQDSDAKVLIVLDVIYSEVQQALSGTNVRHVIGTNIVDLCGFSALKVFFGKLIKKIPSSPLPSTHPFMDLCKTKPEPPDIKVDPVHDIAVLQYTGGTTGSPKAAILTHSNVVANAVQCEAWLWQKEPGMGLIGVLPLFHSYAMTTVMNLAIRIGGFQLLFAKPPVDMADLFKRIEKYRPRQGFIMPGVAILFNKINHHPKVEKYDLSSLMMAISGAGPLPLEVQNKFEELTGSIIIEGYGLSEATPVVCVNPLDKSFRKQGTIGLPLSDTDVRIMDKETGTRELLPLPFALAKTGGLTAEQSDTVDPYTGELVVRGPQVMLGYLNRLEETKAAIRDGWLYTGDIACMDADGFVVIRDRAKDMIKFKGYPIFPAEVEDFLHKHPDVRNAAVIGIPDQEFGELVKAFIVLDPAKKGLTTAEEIKTWAKGKMSHYKIPSLIEFRDELPTTMVGKVLRRVLKEEELAKLKK